MLSLNVDPSTNRVTTAGFAYGANGNTTNLPNVARTLTYDGENRTGGNWYDQRNRPLDRTGVWNGYGLRGERLATYTYAPGQQTWTPVGNPVVDYFVTTSSAATQVSRNIHFGGRLIRVGSVRLMQGTTAPEYYPYGEELTSSSNDWEKFGTYTRESATGLDYANQRYYASAYGRFTAPDPLAGSAMVADPGTWNRYPYTADSVNLLDPSGLIACSGIGVEVNPQGGVAYYNTPQAPILPGFASVGTPGGIINSNDDVGLLTRVVWAESDNGQFEAVDSDANNYEKAAMGQSILNRLEILDGLIALPPGYTAASLGWGPVKATLTQVLSASNASGPQYATIDSSTGDLTSVFKDNLKFPLGSDGSTTTCADVEASFAWAVEVGAINPFSGQGIVTSFQWGSCHPSLEAYFGTFGSPNDFFGIPGATYSPPTTRPTPPPRRKPKPIRGHLPR